jgi:hypothetical protein
MRLRAPLSEIMSAHAADPGIVGALWVHRRSWKRVTLEASEQARRSTRPPRISDASLFAVLNNANLRAAVKKQPPPAEDEKVDAGWDDDPEKGPP